jgi:hypothetical protein
MLTLGIRVAYHLFVDALQLTDQSVDQGNFCVHVCSLPFIGQNLP